MLERVDLGGRTYRQIYDEAQKMIPAYTSAWTNRNLSDPGITVLQSLALLSERLDEAAERTHDNDLAGLLALFGFPVEFACPARLTLFLMFEEWEVLLCGTPFLLRGMQFETDTETAVPGGGITRIWYERDGEKRDVSGLIYAKSRLTLIEADESGLVSLRLVFSDGAKRGERLRIYAEADADCPRNRQEEDGITFAVIVWEALCGDGFVECEARDGTFCFTQSGTVELEIPDDMVLLDGGYQIRATVLRHRYDLAPQIGRIWGGHVALLQQQTLSRCISFDADSSERLTVPLPFWGVETADLLVLGRDSNGGFRQYFADERESRSYCLLQENGRCSVRIRCGKMPRAGVDAVRVLIRRPEALPLLALGNITGYDGQSLPPAWQDAYPVAGTKLMVRHKSGRKAVYEDVENSGCNVFCRIAPSGEITVVRAATDGDSALFFSHLVLTSGEHGNLRGDSLGECGSAGVGGKSPDGVAECFAALSGELETPCVAVTKADYERIALETPGLSLESASADVGSDETVRIAVKPHSDKPGQTHGMLRAEAVAGYLEEHRILNAKIEITPPTWVPIEIETDVSVYPQAISPESQISDAIRNGVKWGEFGAEVSYGRLHAILDGLDCVESVSHLKISADGDAGDNIRRDFATVFYLENLRVSCETRV